MKLLKKLSKNSSRVSDRIFLRVLASFALLGSANIALAGGEDDPLLSKVMINQFEVRNADESNPLVLDGQVWFGKDLQKLWFKVAVERTDAGTEKAELQGLYSQAIAPYWDVIIGLRRDLKPTPNRNWAVIGLQGLAPYFFEIDTALFVGESGRTALRLEAEYELLFTQRLILTPEVEVNFYGQNDVELSIGSGLSDVELGLRLRYEVRREIAPYIGVNWNKSFGGTADFSRDAGKDTGDVEWVIGVRAWF